MSTKKQSVAVDSQTMTYAIEAWQASNGPPSGEHAPEAIALMRLYLYCGISFFLVPTVLREYEQIRDPRRLAEHRSWDNSHFLPVAPEPDPVAVEERAREFAKVNGTKHIKDCRIVAECDLLPHIETLLTNDERMLARLRGQTRQSLEICRPSELWARLAVPQGRKPLTVPMPDNPMSQQDWWRW